MAGLIAGLGPNGRLKAAALAVLTFVFGPGVLDNFMPPFFAGVIAIGVAATIAVPPTSPGDAVPSMVCSVPPSSEAATTWLGWKPPGIWSSAARPRRESCSGTTAPRTCSSWSPSAHGRQGAVL